MASVWLARIEGKHGFEKLVAIKTILPKFAMDEQFQKMLLDEARIASRIEHVNVAQILDVGEQHDVVYVVLEWVDGDSLARLARAAKKAEHPIPHGIILRILADTCGGLHAAHELRGPDGRLLGVVHRDVSPQNILVSTTGMAKLIDFGIAKARDRLVGETSAGVLKGKIRYMAPEQALGKPTDRRADIWAMGAILVRLLTGRAPFEGANELATLNLLTAGRPPPPLPPTVHPSIQAIVSRALSHAPDARFSTAAQMQEELERAMAATGLVTTTSAVAAFAAAHLGPYTEKRKAAVQTALAAAAERQRTRALMQPFVFPEVSTDVSRVAPPRPAAPKVQVDDVSVDDVTVTRPLPAPAALPRLLPTTDPPARLPRTAEPSIDAGESIRVPVSGLSMRASIIAACAAVTVVAFVLLMVLRGGSQPTSAPARPAEVAPRPPPAVVVPPPPLEPVALPVQAPAPAPAISVVAATDLPRAPVAEPVARPRPPPAPVAPVVKPPVESPPAPVATRVNDGF